MRYVDEYLIRAKEKLVLLFTPPFDKSEPHPGYIMGYPPGVRENGGQYTHAALWVAMAFARMGEGRRAVEVLQLLNPVEHARTAEADPRVQEVLSRFPGAKVVEVRRLAPETPESNINADYGSDDPPDGSDGDDL